MPPEVALFVAAIYLSIYAFLCSLSCGAALVRLFPRLGLTPTQALMLRPGWELSTIFLIFGLTTAIVFFGNAASALDGTIVVILGLLVAAVIAKAVLLLLVRYLEPPTGLRTSNILLVVANFGVLLIMAHLGYYLLSGEAFWESANGWVVMAATVTAIVAIGLVPPLKTYGSKQYQALSVIVYLFAFAPIALAWGNMPYLVYKDLTLDQAFSPPLYGDVILAALILALPIAIIGFPQITRLTGSKQA